MVTRYITSMGSGTIWASQELPSFRSFPKMETFWLIWQKCVKDYRLTLYDSQMDLKGSFRLSSVLKILSRKKKTRYRIKEEPCTQWVRNFSSLNPSFDHKTSNQLILPCRSPWQAFRFKQKTNIWTRIEAMPRWFKRLRSESPLDLWWINCILIIDVKMTYLPSQDPSQKFRPNG